MSNNPGGDLPPYLLPSKLHWNKPTDEVLLEISFTKQRKIVFIATSHEFNEREAEEKGLVSNCGRVHTERA
jgi:hypothetical protein